MPTKIVDEKVCDVTISSSDNVKDKDFDNGTLTMEDVQKIASTSAEVAYSEHFLPQFNNNSVASPLINSSPSRKRKVDSCNGASMLSSFVTQPAWRQRCAPTDLDFPREKKPNMHAKPSCSFTFNFGMHLASSIREEDPGRSVLPQYVPDLDSPTPMGCMDWLLNALENKL